MRAGVSDLTTYIPLHSLAKNLGSLCDVLPASYALTGSDITSKVRTKAAAMSRPSFLSKRIGKSPNNLNLDALYAKAEEDLVQEIKMEHTVRPWMNSCILCTIEAKLYINSPQQATVKTRE